MRLNLLSGPISSNQAVAAGQPENLNEMANINSLPLMPELNLASFPSTADFGSSDLSATPGIPDIPRIYNPPIGMDFDSVYMINELMTGFE